MRDSPRAFRGFHRFGERKPQDGWTVRVRMIMRELPAAAVSAGKTPRPVVNLGSDCAVMTSVRATTHVSNNSERNPRERRASRRACRPINNNRADIRRAAPRRPKNATLAAEGRREGARSRGSIELYEETFPRKRDRCTDPTPHSALALAGYRAAYRAAIRFIRVSRIRESYILPFRE